MVFRLHRALKSIKNKYRVIAFALSRRKNTHEELGKHLVTSIVIGTSSIEKALNHPQLRRTFIDQNLRCLQNKKRLVQTVH